MIYESRVCSWFATNCIVLSQWHICLQFFTTTKDPSILKCLPSNCLVFPSDVEGTSADITLRNISPYPPLFKLKTTSREGYYVRPAIGFIFCNECATVPVTLNPKKVNPAVDKFLISSYQYVSSNLDPSSLAFTKTDLYEVWTNIEKDPERKRNIAYDKLKCSILSSK
ncbi:hypothetical protein GEMRC1_010153 [Eukaryota sp. GEM-RC1]